MTENERLALEVFMDKPTIEYTSNDFDDVFDDILSAVVNTQTDHKFGGDDDDDI